MGRCGDCGRSKCVCGVDQGCNGGQYIVKSGATGPVGPQGPSGSAGPTGPNGIAGALGSQIFIGTLASAPAAPSNNSINVDPTTGILYQYSGVWSQRANIFGATGPTGPSSPVSYGNISGTTSFPFPIGGVPQSLFTFSYTSTDLSPKVLTTTWSINVIAPSGVNLTGYTTIDLNTYSTTITIPPTLVGVNVPFTLSRVIIPTIGVHTVTTGIVTDAACTVNLTGTNNDVTTYIR